MKYLIINSVCGIRSTGRIVSEIAERLIDEGHEVVIAFGREQAPEKYKLISKKIGTGVSIWFNFFQARLFDNDGFAARRATKRFLKWADSYEPDVVWLHNLHGYYINVEMLFDWLKKKENIDIRWTLHDCWSFTGHCSYFTYVNCDKWKEHCCNCEQKMEYPTSYFVDNSYNNYERKRAAFTEIESMKLITPSQWLANLVKISFLGNYNIEVVNNTINNKIFMPLDSDIKNRLGIYGKKMILGVASQWQPSKGYYDFLELAKRLDDKYAIVLVGLTGRQKKKLPRNIIGIERTNNAKELAELYSAADLFFNPTYEDNYPTTNLEAIACGTRVLTYAVGGSPESASENGIIINPGDIDEAMRIIYEL